MANPLILALAAGAAVVLLGRKKKGGRSGGKFSLDPKGAGAVLTTLGYQYGDPPKLDVSKFQNDWNSVINGLTSGTLTPPGGHSDLKHLTDIGTLNANGVVDQKTIDAVTALGSHYYTYSLAAARKDWEDAVIEAAIAMPSVGFGDSSIWSDVYNRMMRLGYYYSGTTKPPPSSVVSKFQSDWNTVIGKILSGSIKGLSGMVLIGKLTKDGKAGPKTVEAIREAANQILMGDIDDWKDLIGGGSVPGKINWEQVHDLMTFLGYIPGTGYDSPPTSWSAMAFQIDWNLVLTKMNLGRLTALPKMQSLGMLGTDGIVGPKTLTALNRVFDYRKSGNIGNWKDVVNAARKV